MSPASDASFSQGDEAAAPASPDSEDGNRPPRKRKDRNHEIVQTPSKKLKEAFSAEYEDLVERTIDDLLRPRYDSRLPRLLPSRVKGSWWTSEDKSRFFHALGQVGRLDLEEIATAVGTKSASEIADYLNVLRTATTHHEFHASKRSNLFDISSMQPAFEIGDDCTTVLDDAADAIARRETHWVEQKERAEHPRTWLITRHTAEWIEKCLQSGNEGMQIITNEIPAAFLLHTPTLLSLSKRIFMNSSDLENNWRSYAHDRRTSPCMLYSTLSDLYALVARQTKELIRRSLALASLRIRAEGSSHAVRRIDVLTAISMTHMPVDNRKIWAQVSRKCGLRIYENVRARQAWGKRYSLDEVEDYLGGSDDDRGRYRSQSRSPRDGQKLTSAHADETSAESDLDPRSPRASPSSTSSETRSSASTSSHADSSSMDSTQGLTEDEAVQEGYLELLDGAAGMDEEARLLGLLGKSKGADAGKMKDQLPVKPAPPEKTQRDLSDWTDWTQRVAQWELSA